MKLKNVVALVLILFFTAPSLSFALTASEEKKYGKEMYEEIIQSAPVNNDAYISLHIIAIKDRLEPEAMLLFPVTLTVIDSPTLDAFATPGGYVYVTTGLIALCDKEEELAGVLAHEFGHVKKRHVAKMMEKQKYINIGMLTTMLLGALVGGGSTPGAVIASGMAGAQTMSLKFSREDEAEADREGSIIADKAGYGGLGGAEFLKKLRAAGGDKLYPQYLLTHPYHETRIITLENMWQNNRVTIDAPLFSYLAVRAKILHQSRSTSTDETFINNYLKDKGNPINNYSAALIYSLKGDAEASIRTAGENTSPFRNLFLGEMLISARKFREAADVLKNESDPIARYYLSRAYEGMGENQMAVATLKGLTFYGSAFPEIYYRLGMLYGRTGEEARGYEYLGRYHLGTGKFAQAKTEFEKAISRYGINSPDAREVMRLLDDMKDEKK
jgi:predicted Zn-dependent protease